MIMGLVLSFISICVYMPFVELANEFVWAYFCTDVVDSGQTSYSNIYIRFILDDSFRSLRVIEGGHLGNFDKNMHSNSKLIQLTNV